MLADSICLQEEDRHLDNGRVLEARKAACIPASSLSSCLDLRRAGARLCHRALVQDPYARKWVRRACNEA